jgi:3-hydroxyacyl-[acyl-carrier-protein] dehydratase
MPANRRPARPSRLANQLPDRYNSPQLSAGTLAVCARTHTGNDAPVKFNLIDKIEQITDERIVAVKFVSLAEEYLADHFPTFPVLPGVMMLEALTQAATWLLHRRSGFARSIAVLKDARNVKYGTFVAPGNALRVEVDFHRATDSGGATFKANGFVGDAQAVSARIELSYFNLAEKQPELAGIDAKLTEHNKARWSVLNT